MAVAFAQGVAFLVGFGFALLPSVAPFLAIVAAFSQVGRLRRVDVYWLGGGVLLALPGLVARQWTSSFATLAEVVAAWLLYRTFAGLARDSRGRLDPRVVGAGMLCGLATVIAIGAAHIGSVERISHLSLAILWGNSPNLFAHGILVLGLLIAVLIPRATVRTAALILSALGVLLAGSRDSALVWVVASFFLVLVSPTRKLSTRFIEYGILAAFAIVAATAVPGFGFVRPSHGVDASTAAPSRNLLHGTEAPSGAWWFEQGVTTRSSSQSVAGRKLTVYRVTKKAPEPWRRLQQDVIVRPGATYTLSAWVRRLDPASSPGLEGWGENGNAANSLVLVSRLNGEAWHAQVRGSATLLTTGETTYGGWTRVWVALRYDGSQPLHWWVGFTPDARSRTGTSADVAGLQLEQGAAPSRYEPGSPTNGLWLVAARLPAWRTAWRSFLERPVLGRPGTPFARYFAANGGPLTSYYEIPAHAHDLLLQTLYRSGVVGLLGLVMLLYGVGRSAIRTRDLPFLVAFAGVLLANVFDYTLFFGGIIYPLAVVAGWRSTAEQSRAAPADGRARAAMVRLVLAGMDVAAAALALLFALVIRSALTGTFGLRPFGGGIPVALAYAVLLWPVLSWREGLYPGYGLTPPQELKGGVLASAQAGLLLVAGSMLFAKSLPVPRSLMLLTVVIALVTVPVGRALAKRVLMHLGYWGRDVIILGAGETGRRVARSLRRNPLGGLRPVAFFDDGAPDLPGDLEGVPVQGRLSDASRVAEQLGVTHAIVAMPNLGPAALADIVQRSTAMFRRVQFVPHMPGIPSEDVFTSQLDDMLALEIRSGLFVPANRVAKRVVDLLGGLLVSLVLSPVLIGLYLWVRLDSPGPAFHRSERLGESKRNFDCIKFRTMHMDAESRLQQILEEDPELAEEYSNYHKLANDPRLTRAGRWLRKTSLDELPQLFNVIAGQMSLVGPRPYLARELPDIGTYADILFRAKPGMTGYWQVSARNEVTFEERLVMESHYVRNWSIWWDVILFLQTPGVVVNQRGAR